MIMHYAKPSETFYNEYRFRCRIEARWAVFFDAVGLPYEYEREGFVLDDGTKYLPDFWLPSLKLWIEIKSAIDIVETIPFCTDPFSMPVVKALRSCELFKMMRRFRNSQQWLIACVIGQPGQHRIWFFGHDMSSSSAGE